MHTNTPIVIFFSLPSPPPAVSISSLIPPILLTSQLLAGIKSPFARLRLRRVCVLFFSPWSPCVSSFHFFHLHYAKLRKRLASDPGLSRYLCPFPKDPGVFPPTGSGFCQGVLSVVSRKKKNSLRHVQRIREDPKQQAKLLAAPVFPPHSATAFCKVAEHHDAAAL